MKQTLRQLLTFTALALLATAPVLAAGSVVGLAPGASSLTFQPQVEYSSLTVTVSGPDGVSTTTFEAGAAATVDLAGLADGSYTWELYLAPALDDEARALMAGARDEASRGAVMSQLLAAGKLPAEPLVASGYFTLAGGQLVADTEEESVAAVAGEASTGMIRIPGTSRAGGVRNVTGEDQVILDDLIVDGSACVGDDCVNGESFGFDTIRLKENNLRIKFQDTSNSGSFPSNDWQLTANDSANGGANRFSIDDIDGGRTPFTIEASAPSNSLYVDDGGRVGLGTSTPVVELHVIDGDTPTLRLQQDGSSGFTPQTWDVAGNETNFFVRDATNGSLIPFKIRPTAPTNSLYINTDGNVGIGDTSPAEKLNVLNGNIGIERTDGTIAALRLSATGAADSGWNLRANNGNGGFNFTEIATGLSPLLIRPGAPGVVLEIDTGGIEVTGTVTVNGSQVHPDYVFEPDYALPSIDEQAAYMFANKHLPAVGSGNDEEGSPRKVSILDHQFGMLEELEKAHLYIHQLNEAVKEKDAAIAELMERLEKLEAAIQQ